MIIPLLADATNDFAGQSLFLYGGVCANILIALFAGLGYFATKREVSSLEKRLDSQDEELAGMREERREDVGELHRKTNNAAVSLANLEGQMTAFIQSFEKFTRIVESTGKIHELESEIRDMPGKIVQDILNAQKLGRLGGKHD